MSGPQRYDLAVVGAGPAGLAAAVRARWLKRYHMVPAKTVLIDPASLGGLTQLGTTYITGPGWSYNADEIGALLTADIAHLNIPHIRQRVLCIAKDAGRFQLTLAGGTAVSALAVVLSPGMKALSGEPQFWNRGVTATSLGLGAAADKLRRLVSEPGERRLVIAGTDGMRNLVGLVQRHRNPACTVTFIVEPTEALAANTPFPGGDHAVLHGLVVGMEGAKRLESVAVQKVDGALTRVPADKFVIDFLSYESAPARTFRCDGLAVTDDGFIAVDRRQRTSVEGIFAAGDATGMPAAVSTAVGEGVIAGFEAYRHIFHHKFACEPALFAYYGHAGALDESTRDFPPISMEHYAVEMLCAPPDFDTGTHPDRYGAFVKAGMRRAAEQVRNAGSPVPLAALTGPAGLADEALIELLEIWLTRKWVTLHRVEDCPGLACEAVAVERPQGRQDP